MNRLLWWRFLNFSRGGALAWMAVLLAYTLILFYFYQSVGQTEVLKDYLEALPEPMKQAFGLADMASIVSGDVIRIEAWLNMEYFSWLPLLLGIYAIFFGSGLVARDAERGALEFLLSQPVRRHQVVLAKFLVFLTSLSAIMAASVVGILLGAVVFGQEVGAVNLLLTHLQTFVLVVAVAGYASLFSILYLNSGRALMLSGLITAAMYILNFMAPSLGSFQWLQKLSFFHYYQALPILLEGQLHIAGLALHAGAAVAALAAAALLFERRDIVPG